MKRMGPFLMVAVLLALVESADALCVGVHTANLRSGPGTRYEKTWQVFQYMPFQKVTRRGNWFKVRDVDGDMHWIYSKLVTSRYRCAAVKVEEANFRTGPGTQYRELEASPALKYDAFRVLRSKGAWVKVKDELGNIGWIFRRLLWIP